MLTSKFGISIAEMQRGLEIKDYKNIWIISRALNKRICLITTILASLT